MRRLVAVWLVSSSFACRPPVDDPGTATEPDAGAVDVSGFLGDVPALGGRWYDYDDKTHALSPKAESYLVRDEGEGGTRYAAVRITSYYSADALESGFFSFERAVFASHDDVTAAWSAPTSVALTANVKEAPVCVDLFVVEGDVVRDCGGADWQLSFRTAARVIPEAGFAVREPGVFPRGVDGIEAAGGARIATVAASLDALPDPTTLGALPAGAPSTWTDAPSFDKALFAPAWPLAGQVVGARFAEVADDVLFVFTGRRTLGRVAWSVDGDSVVLRASAAALELSTFEAEALPPPTETRVVVDASHPRALVRLEEAGAVVDDALLPATLAEVGDELRYDLELLLLDDGSRTLRLSPAAAVHNATVIDGVTDLATATPPSAR